MNTYFKVVTKTLESVTRLSAIKYIENDYVYAQNGNFLFVFDTEQNARNACTNHGWKNTLIYKCECEGIYNSGDVPNFLKKISHSGTLPKGTVFAYGVKLTECVTKKDIKTTWYFVPRYGGSITELQEYSDGTFSDPRYEMDGQNMKINGHTYTVNMWQESYYLTSNKDVAFKLLDVANINGFTGL